MEILYVATMLQIREKSGVSAQAATNSIVLVDDGWMVLSMYFDFIVKSWTMHFGGLQHTMLTYLSMITHQSSVLLQIIYKFARNA